MFFSFSMFKRCISEECGVPEAKRSKRSETSSSDNDDDDDDSDSSSWAPSASEDDEQSSSDDDCAPAPDEKYTRSKGRAQTSQTQEELNAAMDKADAVVDHESDLSSDTSEDSEDDEEEDDFDEEEEEEESDEDDEYSDDDSFVTSDEEEEESDGCHDAKLSDATADNILGSSSDVDGVYRDAGLVDGSHPDEQALANQALVNDIPAILTRCDAGIDACAGDVA